MKPWLNEICERVKNGTTLPAMIGDATAIIEDWGYDWNEDDGLEMAAELISCLIERCEQQDDELARLRRLEEAAIEWANVGSVGLPRLAQGAQQRLYALARKAAEKARDA